MVSHKIAFWWTMLIGSFSFFWPAAPACAIFYQINLWFLKASNEKLLSPFLSQRCEQCAVLPLNDLIHWFSRKSRKQFQFEWQNNAAIDCLTDVNTSGCHGKSITRGLWHILSIKIILQFIYFFNIIKKYHFRTKLNNTFFLYKYFTTYCSVAFLFSNLNRVFENNCNQTIKLRFLPIMPFQNKISWWYRADILYIKIY